MHKKAVEFRAEGKSYTEVASTLGFSKPTVWLKLNPKDEKKEE